MTEKRLVLEDPRKIVLRDAVLDQVRLGAKTVADVARGVEMTQMAFANALNTAFQDGFLTQWGSGIAFTDKGHEWAKRKDEFEQMVRTSVTEIPALFANEPKRYGLLRLYSEVWARGPAIRILDQPVDAYLKTLKASGEIGGFGYHNGRYFLWVSREADAHNYPRAINTTPVGIVRDSLPSLASLSV